MPLENIARSRKISARVFTDAPRKALGDTAHMLPIRLIDSITELTASDAGCIAVSGSHGGISSARFALAARP